MLLRRTAELGQLGAQCLCIFGAGQHADRCTAAADLLGQPLTVSTGKAQLLVVE